MLGRGSFVGIMGVMKIYFIYIVVIIKFLCIFANHAERPAKAKSLFSSVNYSK